MLPGPRLKPRPDTPGLRADESEETVLIPEVEAAAPSPPDFCRRLDSLSRQPLVKLLDPQCTL
jgi:hypothetical protein